MGFHVYSSGDRSPISVHLRRDFLVHDKVFRTEIAQSTMGSFSIVMLAPMVGLSVTSTAKSEGHFCVCQIGFHRI